jgi:hypothetical protein
MDKELQVKRRQKVETGGTETYTVSLVSEDSLVRLTVRSKDADLFQIFKKDAWIPITIGADPQTTLDETPGAGN